MKNKLPRVTEVRLGSEEAEQTVIRSDNSQMREPSPSSTSEGPLFTIEEHIGVQKQIERRAHEIWCAGRCRDATALSDWIQAERETLEEFIGAYARRQSFPPGSTNDVSPSLRE
jgi:hypothetical protein